MKISGSISPVRSRQPAAKRAKDRSPGGKPWVKAKTRHPQKGGRSRNRSLSEKLSHQAFGEFLRSKMQTPGEAIPDFFIISGWNPWQYGRRRI